MGSVRQIKGTQGHQDRLRQRQDRWNRTQFLALSAQFMSEILEDVAFPGRSESRVHRERNSTDQAPFS